MRILGVDSSSVTASVALTENTVTLAEGFINNGLTHSQTLLPLVSQTLSQVNIALNSVDAFAIAVGPGSFTGLRIGIAMIKGMAGALGKPCIAVSTLEALAYGARELEGIICAVMDARCSQVYNALFRCTNGTLERLCEDRAILVEDLYSEIAQINSPIFLVGDGAEMCYNTFVGRLSSIQLADQNKRHLHGSSVAGLAYERMILIPANELKPVYLRLPQAERELKRKRENNDSTGL